MNQTIISRIIILASLIALAFASGCEVLQSSPTCNFTVICHEETTDVKLPKCSEEPDVTLVVMNSVVNIFKEYFFEVFNFRFRVSKIVAIDNAWASIDGSAFIYFENVVSIDLSNNKIENMQSMPFVRLHKMKFLNLSSNLLEGLDSSPFGMWDNNIEEIDLSHNRLKKIGFEMNSVRHLKTLHLQYNQLTSIREDAFELVYNLTYLNLQHNLLTEISPFLKYLKGLTTLNLSYNHLSKLPANEINYLVSLVNVDISHNQLKLIETNCFSEATHLQKADFSFNDIEMVIGENMFINNTELQYLNFYNNNITEVHPNAFKNCDLRYLNLDKNHIIGDVPKIQDKTEPILSKNVTDVFNSNVTPDTNATTLSTSDELNLLEKEIQTIRSELNSIISVVDNLMLTLQTYNNKIDKEFV